MLHGRSEKNRNIQLRGVDLPLLVACLQRPRANREKFADPDLVSKTAVEIQLIFNERPSKPLL